MYEEIRTAIEVVSAIMCFILLRFMIKPYEITGESRYIGLPLGFGFLGATYILSAFAYYTRSILGGNTLYIQLIARTFAFLFIAITYYFSKTPTKNSRRLWKITLTMLFTLLIISFLIADTPYINLDSYGITRNILRAIDLIIILYICIHTFRSHIEKPDPTTLLIPLSYTTLLVSQYSVLLYQLDASGMNSAFFAALILRLVFLSVLLIVSFGAFYRIKNEDHR
jgi:hypothetical protein